MRRSAADAAETRRRIVDAALLVLAERGYDGTTFEHVAARIGMTRGAVHHHFRGGKEELLAAVLTDQWGRYGATLLAPLDDAAVPAGARLATFLVGYLELLAADEGFRALVTVNTLVAPAVGVGLAEHRRSLDRWRAALGAVVEVPGTLRAGVDAATAVTVLLNLVLGLTVSAALEPDRLPATPAARRTMARTVVDGLVAP